MAPADRIPLLVPDGEIAAEPVEPVDPQAEVEFPTVRMAEVYRRQGLFERAREILERVLENDPTHGEAAEILRALEPPRAVPAPPGPSEPAAMLDFEEPPARYGRTAVALLPVGPRSLYAYWELPDEARRRAGGGPMRLVIASFAAELGEVHKERRGVDLPADAGEWFVHELRPGALYCAALGVMTGNSFVPVAHTRTVATPPDGPSADLTLEWMEVAPLSAPDAPGARTPLQIVRRGRAAAGGEALYTRWVPGREKGGGAMSARPAGVAAEGGGGPPPDPPPALQEPRRDR